VYLKLGCNLDFPAIGAKLAPDASPDSFDHDSENVYEWMYVKIQGLAFSLNVSREHGWADIDDELLDFDSTAAKEELQALVKPGPIYIFGWDLDTNYYVAPLPEWLPQYIADKLNADVLVFDRRINVESPDGDPVAVVKPHADNRK
jgi:hypothetical protein